MTWDQPGFLAAALTLPAIILLHLLARRRRSVVVPSLVLWERLLENQRKSVSLRRLNADMLLFLQLLTAALLVLTLAGPRLEGGRNRITGPTVLVMDVSAGMSAVEGNGGTRFDMAVEEAAGLIRRKSAGAEVMIITGGKEAGPVTGFRADRGGLIAALKGLAPSGEAGDPGQAVRAAEALAAGRPDAQVVFITDAAFDDGPPISGVTSVIQVGGPADNVGITVFAVRYLPGGGREALVVIENHGTLPRNTELTIKIGENELLAETLSIAPDDRAERTVNWNEPRAGELTATLDVSNPEGTSAAGGQTDGLAQDNQVTAVLTPEGPIRTALFTPGNWFLETLLAAHPDVSLSVFRYEPDQGEGSGFFPEPAEGPWDLVVADRIYPRSAIEAPLLAIYPFPEHLPPLPLEALGRTEEADPVFRDTGHPVTRNLDLSRITVRSALKVSAAPEARTLVSSSAGPLLMAGERGDFRGRWIAFTFDLLDSSLPLRPAFPILMSDAIAWLTAGNPDVELSARSGTGPLNSGESDLRPRWDGYRPDGSKQSGRPGATRAAAPGAGPIGKLLAVLALLSVLAEWSLQTRNWRKA